jgi:nucleotide-binding universal stress UspA family protein
MSLFDRVVVGVDGTDFGFEALQQALVLSPIGASALAVTALDTAIAGYAGFEMDHFIAQFEEEAERARAKAVEIMRDRPNCTANVVRGDAKRVLRHACEEYDATLLALGARRSSRFLGMLTGETASTLLHHAARSVLFARPQWGQRWHPNLVVVGLDGSDSSLTALAVGDDLAERLGSALQVVTATGGKSVEREDAWAERVTKWDPGHPFAALLDRSALVDLLILGSRGLHGVRALGSVSERVAHRAHCSVLIIHPTPPI